MSSTQSTLERGILLRFKHAGAHITLVVMQHRFTTSNICVCFSARHTYSHRDVSTPSIRCERQNATSEMAIVKESESISICEHVTLFRTSNADPFKSGRHANTIRKDPYVALYLRSFTYNSPCASTAP